MAKRIDPFPAATTPPEFNKVVRAYILNGIEIAKEAVAMPVPTEATLAELRLMYSNALAAWERLHTWKKLRWSLCAISTYGDIGTITGVRGHSGYSLYIQCWLEQNPEADKQPISPCSARVTDPLASPWNYQP